MTGVLFEIFFRDLRPATDPWPPAEEGFVSLTGRLLEVRRFVTKNVVRASGVGVPRVSTIVFVCIFKNVLLAGLCPLTGVRCSAGEVRQPQGLGRSESIQVRPTGTLR